LSYYLYSLLFSYIKPKKERKPYTRPACKPHHSSFSTPSSIQPTNISNPIHAHLLPSNPPHLPLTNPTPDLDTSGSGNETISHLYEPNNARLTISFCAFDGAPNIVRLWGHGRVLERGSPEYSALIPPHGEREQMLNMPGLRAIIWLDIEQVGTSCGFSVPYYDFVGYRTQLEDFAANRQRKFERTGDWHDSYEQYWAWKNAKSVDGLPGLKRAVRDAREKGVQPLVKFVGLQEVYGQERNGVKMGGRHSQWVVLAIGIFIGLLIALLLQRADRYVTLVREVIPI